MIKLNDLEGKYERKIITNSYSSDDDDDSNDTDKGEDFVTSSTCKEDNNASERNVKDDNERREHTVVLPVNDNDEIIVQDATVVLSQSEKLNKQIRDEMYQNAITVQEENIVALPDKDTTDTTTTPTKTLPVDKEGTKRGCARNWCMVLFVFVALVATVLATAFTVRHFTKRADNDKQNDNGNNMSPAPTRMMEPITPTPTPTPTPYPTPFPTSYPTPYPTLPPTTTKFLEMQELLLAQNLSSSAWFNPESPQYRALNWISNSDGYTINNVGLSVERIVQRYSLATLYYATGGDPEDAEKNQWKENYNFLSNRSECSWNDGNRGVFCSSNLISTMWIGTFVSCVCVCIFFFLYPYT